ncbi:MAG: hypothetical protein F6J93_04640 [Oscillatoria sp. SIO1A7]|nr:hypothetical protein [Oscillatoria sp. SIO1A7]
MKDAYTPLVSFFFSSSSPYTLHPTPYTLIFCPIPITQYPPLGRIADRRR